MTTRQPRDLAASVRQRLMNLSRERGEDFQLVLTRYGLERLLFRLAQSSHASEFVLKGAALFQLWTGQPHRSTRDLDLLGQGEPSTDLLRQLFQNVCSLSVSTSSLKPQVLCSQGIMMFEHWRSGCSRWLSGSRPI